MTTSNGECPGDVVPGTGIMLNNMLGEDDLHPDGFHAAPPGTRAASMMSPTIVLSAAGHPELVLGSGGSKRIRSAILQVLVGVIDHGRDLPDAIDAPRLHWDTDHVEIEPGFDDAVVAALRELDRSTCGRIEACISAACMPSLLAAHRDPGWPRATHAVVARCGPLRSSAPR